MSFTTWWSDLGYTCTLVAVRGEGNALPVWAFDVDLVNYHQRLLERFRMQETFSQGYSPLYTAVFGQLAAWLAADSAELDPLVRWLLEAGQGRQVLDVTLLVAAGLHKDVLAGAPEVQALAAYFPSIGGNREPDAAFEMALREAINGRRESLTTFIQTANVQTNETGRGLCWLLPLMSMPWKQVCLVDLGASAGLNLLANKRAFRLVTEEGGETLLDVGEASPVQFVTRCRGNLAPLAQYRDGELPEIVGRFGCDLLPFSLDSVEAERTLMSYVWGDQVARLERLREGIDAFREVQAGDVPVQLYRVDLPDELGGFLRDAVPGNECPVVIYNTFMTAYLSDKGASFRETIGRWAAGRKQPVLWLQWEPV
ncbi:MAG: DUF2332 family protein, partial [Candidatus Promineifilaceae bacterium]